jgi:hypothetical protein
MREAAMGPTFRAVAYRTALLVSTVFVLAVLLAIVVNTKAHAQFWTAVFTYGGALLSAVVAFSGVFFGWGTDRREAKDLKLKVKGLEIKLHDLESKLLLAILRRPSMVDRHPVVDTENGEAPSLVPSLPGSAVAAPR